VLETLRQPLETGRVRLSRVRYAVEFPARVQLVAAMNPCPCGQGGETCVCGPSEVQRYRARISGPLLDRIDLLVRVHPAPWSDLQPGRASAPTSPGLRNDVLRARGLQRRRGVDSNAALEPKEVWRACSLPPPALGLLENAVERFRLSARGVHRVLRVARTVADLAGSPRVEGDHLAEAVRMRMGSGASLPSDGRPVHN
ncbi:MAG: ATP-binding protein, partial [Gemmatimonadetes bacterium]|nr:ATP-binding protein [Gemmatimonadota bacterium]